MSDNYFTVVLPYSGYHACFDSHLLVQIIRIMYASINSASQFILILFCFNE